MLNIYEKDFKILRAYADMSDMIWPLAPLHKSGLCVQADSSHVKIEVIFRSKISGKAICNKNIII